MQVYDHSLVCQLSSTHQVAYTSTVLLSTYPFGTKMWLKIVYYSIQPISI